MISFMPTLILAHVTHPIPMVTIAIATMAKATIDIKGHADMHGYTREIFKVYQEAMSDGGKKLRGAGSKYYARKVITRRG